MSLYSLLQTTNAYNIILNDKINNKLSHAYLIVCDDEDMLEDYLIFFSKLIMCKNTYFCNECRICKNIEKKTYTDVVFLPEKGNKITTNDADLIISKSILKPFEDSKKMFVVNYVHNMNIQSQNKLLKTIEDPPNNTYFLFGATSDYLLLPTFKSRIKKLAIFSFSENNIIENLKDNFNDLNNFLLSVKLCDGRIGKLKKNYDKGDLQIIEDIVFDVLLNLKNSKEILKYSLKFDKNNFRDFLILLKITLMNILYFSEGKIELIGQNNQIDKLNQLSVGFKKGSILACIKKIGQIERSYYYNGNFNMMIDKILLSVLEEKYKWQKL